MTLTNFSSWNVGVIFLNKEQVDFEEINEFDDNTSRGRKGFGLTGLKQFLVGCFW